MADGINDITLEDLLRRTKSAQTYEWDTTVAALIGELRAARKERDELKHALTLERADAQRETIEECAKRVEAMIGSLAVSEDRARSAGRHGVADCRQSDIETCERAAANIRALTPAPEAEKGRKNGKI